LTVKVNRVSPTVSAYKTSVAQTPSGKISNDELVAKKEKKQNFTKKEKPTLHIVSKYSWCVKGDVKFQLTTIGHCHLFVIRVQTVPSNR
jgi:hypothetical protein